MKTRFLILILLLTLSLSFAQNYRFAVFGDNRPYNNEDVQPPVFNKIIREIEIIHPDFAVDVGDFIYGYGANKVRTCEEYEEFLNAIKPLTIPFYPVVGNHEVAGFGGQACYKKMLKRPLYYAFNYEKDHFVVLDTNVNTPNGKFTQAQYEWFKADLENSTSVRNIFIFMHKPVYNERGKSDWSDKTMSKKVYKFINAFNELYHNVRVVFEGHEHRYWRKTVNGITYVITGGGGAPLENQPQNGGVYHFLLVSVNGTHTKIDVFLPSYFKVKYISNSPREMTAIVENRLPSVYNGLLIKGLKFVLPKACTYEVKSNLQNVRIWKITPCTATTVNVWVEAKMRFSDANIASLIKATISLLKSHTNFLKGALRKVNFYIDVKATCK